jgi:hypothetical protein
VFQRRTNHDTWQELFEGSAFREDVRTLLKTNDLWAVPGIYMARRAADTYVYGIANPHMFRDWLASAHPDLVEEFGAVWTIRLLAALPPHNVSE